MAQNANHNLKDPTTRGNPSLLKPDFKKLVYSFIKAQTLLDGPDQDFNLAMQEVSPGLIQVSISAREVRNSLLAGNHH